MAAVDIRRIEKGQWAAVEAAGHLFDHLPRRDWTVDFLEKEGHHLLIAYLDNGPVGFVSGVEIAHPDKGVEMLLYELGVDKAHRRQGVGRSLVEALLALARKVGCSGMWVPIEPDNGAAIATYRSANASPPESAAILTWEFTE
jgi:ribosomal protein S18 acetylase RimI-like enzyme